MDEFIEWLDKATVFATKVLAVVAILHILYQIFFR